MSADERTHRVTDSHHYTIDVTSTGLKTGVLGPSEDTLPLLDVASPPQFGGPDGVWSPEHLFVAALASCLMTTFRAMAEASRIEVLEYSDSATGSLVQDDTRKYAFDTVTLRPRVVIADEAHVDRTLRILHKAETDCLISRSVASEILLEPTVLSGQTVAAAH
jgi:organic hydroperoxide reductase OsmC/OhrA